MNSKVFSYTAIATATVTLILLASLHLLSPEFDPSWRMVSEYAAGKYAWVLSLFFAFWAVSNWATAKLLWGQVSSKKGKFAVGLLAVAGIGEAMAAVFDISKPLHSVAAFVGIGGFTVAATMLSYILANTDAWAKFKNSLLWTGNLVWISVVVMILSFVALIYTYSQSGADMTAAVVNEIPEGVIAVVGWANRFLVIVFNLWVINVAAKALMLEGNKTAEKL